MDSNLGSATMIVAVALLIAVLQQNLMDNLVASYGLEIVVVGLALVLMAGAYLSNKNKGGQ